MTRLSQETGLTRKQLLELHARFQVLHTTAQRRHGAERHVGVPVDKFVSDVGISYRYPAEFLRRVFCLANVSHTGKLVWPEYAHAMGIIQTDQETQRVELFFQVA